MSKQTSFVTFKGKMGGISFYQNKNGEHVARKAGGPSKERIMNDPKFERVRENLSEFTGLAKATSSFTQIFAPVKNLKDGRVRGRISKVYRDMMKVDETALRGKRQIFLSQHKNNLRKFELNAISPFRSSFTKRFPVSHSTDRTTVTATITNLNISRSVVPPPLTSHFQLIQLAGVLADTVYNETTSSYESTNDILDAISDVTFSEYYPLGSTEPVSITLETTIETTAPLTDDVSVVHAVGILFFLKDGSAYYPSNQGMGMRILGVY